jgi:RimJ/RimL family protein N-acetyltransferase
MNKKKAPRTRRRTKRPSKKPKPFFRSTEPRATDADVRLEPGKGSPKTGGGLGGHFWKVYFGESMAGRAYINYHENEAGEPRPSVTVMLNQQSQGRGIGTIAFRRAAELSQYDEVYATVAKKNIASRNALERAGYAPAEEKKGAELYMVWRRDAA